LFKQVGSQGDSRWDLVEGKAMDDKLPHIQLTGKDQRPRSRLQGEIRTTAPFLPIQTLDKCIYSFGFSGLGGVGAAENMAEIASG